MTDELLRKALLKDLKEKQQVHEGWGHSVVGGVEVWTKPSNQALGNVNKYTPQSEEEMALESINSPFVDYSGDILRNQVTDKLSDSEKKMLADMVSRYATPDNRGFIGDYHVNDLIKQYDSMISDKRFPITEDDMDEMIIRSELDKDSPNRSKRDKESDKYIAAAIRYGRLVKPYRKK